MEEYEIKKECCDSEDSEGETLNNKFREYNINNNYILRLETREDNIIIFLSLNENIKYNYKSEMNLSEIVKLLGLNIDQYSNFELILKLFDKIYSNNNIDIKINYESCNIIIKFINESKESKKELKLYKNNMQIDDKLNLLYNMYMSNKIEMNNKINEIINKMEKKEKEMKDIIDKKDILINELNDKIIIKERRIKELENNQKNEIIKSETINSDNFNIGEEINKLNDKIKENKKIINNMVQEIYKNIKIRIQEELKDIEYEKKVNYKFIKDPTNLKLNQNILTTNTPTGWNDIFELYLSYKDNKEYLASPNSKTYNIEIYQLNDNRLILKLDKHKNYIRTIRYFINNKNKNEYLISADDEKRVIIWDITNNYKIKCNIDTKYKHIIYSCLLVFPNNIDNFFIITSTFNKSGSDEYSATKIYLSNVVSKPFRYISETYNTRIFYLLSWHNSRNNNDYIIQFASEKIMINNLLEEELYAEFTYQPESDHFSGFIYSKHNKDYLCSSSYNGFINIWDLYDKVKFNVIDTKKCNLAHIIEWNQKYFIVADVQNKLIKIIDIEKNKIIFNIKSGHIKDLTCIKKIIHPIYGESLFSAGQDNIIKLWTID